MGRKLKPLKDRLSNIFLFEYPLHRPEDYKTMEIFYEVLQREGIGFNKGMKAAIELFIERHGDGNYQTMMNSYQPGGIKSEGQIEQEIVRYFQGLERDLTLKELLAKVMEDLGYPRGRASKVADGLAKQMSDLGVKIWR